MRQTEVGGKKRELLGSEQEKEGKEAAEQGASRSRESREERGEGWKETEGGGVGKIFLQFLSAILLTLNVSLALTSIRAAPAVSSYERLVQVSRETGEGAERMGEEEELERGELPFA